MKPSSPARFDGATRNASEARAKNDPAAVAPADVLSAYDECLIGMSVTKNTEKYGYEGMGIRFPPSYSMYTTDSGGYGAATYEPYITFELTNSGWQAFLKTYWGLA